MAMLMKATLLAAATTAATLFAQPAQSATTVLQPHSILLDQANQASTEQVVPVGRGFGGGGRGFGGGGMMWRHGGMGGWHGGMGGWHGGWRGVGWRGGGWGWRRGWGGRGFVRRGWGWGGPAWGWGGGWPVYGYGYGGGCPYGFVWTYRWGCVPYGGYGYGGYGYGAPGRELWYWFWWVGRRLGGRLVETDTWPPSPEGGCSPPGAGEERDSDQRTMGMGLTMSFSKDCPTDHLHRSID